jgi:hypothetical protein
VAHKVAGIRCAIPWFPIFQIADDTQNGSVCDSGGSPLIRQRTFMQLNFSATFLCLSPATTSAWACFLPRQSSEFRALAQ